MSVKQMRKYPIPFYSPLTQNRSGTTMEPSTHEHQPLMSTVHYLPLLYVASNGGANRGLVGDGGVGGGCGRGRGGRVGFSSIRDTGRRAHSFSSSSSSVSLLQPASKGEEKGVEEAHGLYKLGHDVTRRRLVMHLVQERDDLAETSQGVGGASMKSLFVRINENSENSQQRLPLT